MAHSWADRALRPTALVLVVGSTLAPCHTALADTLVSEARTGAAGKRAGDRGEAVDDFIARIARIKAAIGDLTWTGGLLAYEDFTEVHARPEAYLDQALDALRRGGAGEQEKIIIALSMQKLPLPELVRFSEQVLKDLEAGLVSERVFEHAVFPTYDWNTALVEGYGDAGVQRLLQLVLASPSVSPRRKEIVKDEILSGNAQRDVLELRAAGELK